MQRLTLTRAALLGALLGLAVLGSVRLFALPLVLGAYLVWRHRLTRRAFVAAAAVVGAFGVVLTPWIVRNSVNVGCAAVTTDSRALWEANNVNTYRTLASGGWIDHVPPLPGAPPTPQDAYESYLRTGQRVHVDECAQMRFYRSRVLDFWSDHPDEKARLAVQAAGMLWQPAVTQTEGRPGEGTWLDSARSWAQPLYFVTLAALAAFGLARLHGQWVWLVVVLLAYQTLLAMLFVGATRYRVSWDFLIALVAATGIAHLVERVAVSRARGPREAPT